MIAQDKVWGLVDAKGRFLEAFPTRAEAREVKKWYNDDPFNPYIANEVTLPVGLVQYQSLKKVS